MKRAAADESDSQRHAQQQRVDEAPVDTVIYARWIVPVIPPKHFLEHSALVIKGGKIVDILPNAEARRKYADARQTYELGELHALIPGLINMHTHSGMSLLRGFADDCSLMEWLQHYMWPAEGKFMGPDFVRDGSAFSIGEMIRSGVTCMNDMYFFPGTIAEVVNEFGFRAVIGAPIFEFPSKWASGPDEGIEKAMELFHQYKDHDRVQIALSPHAPYTVADPTFKKVQQVAAEHDVIVHTHLHETATEITDHVSSEVHGGLRPLARMDKLGLLNKRLIAAHMTQLTDEEIRVFAKHGSHVVHCPKSNMKLSSGVCPVHKLHTAGVNVTIGTDGPASNDDLDLLGELRAGSLLDKLFANDRQPLPSHEWLAMATINAAYALGLDDRIGSLEIGKDADVIAVRIHTEPVYNPIVNLCYVGNNSVKYSWVQGRCLMENGRLLTMDQAAITQRAREWGPRIASWHLERKRVDLTRLHMTVAELEKAGDNADAEHLESAVQSLGHLRDSMFHWMFFAKSGHDIGASLVELEEASSTINRHLEAIKALQRARSSPAPPASPKQP